MIRKLAGVLLILLGLALGGWVFYNLFIEMQPAAEGRSPIPALIFMAGLLYLGFKYLFTEREEGEK